MKIDINGKLTIGMQRTLKILQDTMITLLEEKSFDEIQIKELCDRSMISRATFYNYFEDKYDLLHYVFVQVEYMIYPQISEIKTDIPIVDIEKKIFDTADRYNKVLMKILRKNPLDSTFTKAFEAFFKDAVYRAIIHSTEYSGYDIPNELIAGVNSAGILSVFEWVYIKGNLLSREQIHEYLNKLYVTMV